MILLPVRIGPLVAVIAGAGIAGWMWRGAIAERDIATIEKSIAQQREQAATEARATERKQQEKVNEALREQNSALAGVADKLRLELGRLRNRPERPAVVPEAPELPVRVQPGPSFQDRMQSFLQGKLPEPTKSGPDSLPATR